LIIALGLLFVGVEVGSTVVVVVVESAIRHQSSLSVPQLPSSSVYITSVFSGEQHG